MPRVAPRAPRYPYPLPAALGPAPTFEALTRWQQREPDAAASPSAVLDALAEYLRVARPLDGTWGDLPWGASGPQSPFGRLVLQAMVQAHHGAITSAELDERGCFAAIDGSPARVSAHHTASEQAVIAIGLMTPTPPDKVLFAAAWRYADIFWFLDAALHHPAFSRTVVERLLDAHDAQHARAADDHELTLRELDLYGALAWAPVAAGDPLLADRLMHILGLPMPWRDAGLLAFGPLAQVDALLTRLLTDGGAPESVRREAFAEAVRAILDAAGTGVRQRLACLTPPHLGLLLGSPNVEDRQLAIRALALLEDATPPLSASPPPAAMVPERPRRGVVA